MPDQNDKVILAILLQPCTTTCKIGQYIFVIYIMYIRSMTAEQDNNEENYDSRKYCWCLYTFPHISIDRTRGGRAKRCPASFWRRNRENFRRRVIFQNSVRSKRHQNGRAGGEIQKIQTAADSASKDLQSVDATIALNYHLSPDAVATIYQETRKRYQVRIIDPAIQEAMKAASAQFNAEELITKRSEV